MKGVQISLWDSVSNSFVYTTRMGLLDNIVPEVQFYFFKKPPVSIAATCGSWIVVNQVSMDPMQGPRAS